jgi:FtsP/CotA-like multicopper oxidase with cupredoxin domain
MTKERKPKVNSTTTQDDSQEELNQNDLEVSPIKGKKKLNRRGFLAAGTGAAAAALIAGQSAEAQSQAQPQHDGHGQATVGQAAPVTVTAFPQPPVKPSNPVTKTLSEQLVIGMLSSTQQVRCYNGNIPGPTFKVRAGDRMSLALYNKLPPNPGGSLDFYGKPNAMNNPNGFNSTNLHTHGLHVSPTSRPLATLSSAEKAAWGLPENATSSSAVLASDDVLIEIDPGEVQYYCIEIPSFHAPGTHWYHAHKHGSSALQLAQGLAGVLIIEEPPEQRIVPYAINDYVWLIQEVLTNADAQRIYTQGMPASQFYVNGQLGPTLTMQQGEVQRWRIVNGTGTPRGLAQLQLLSSNGTAQTMYQFAMDGISFYGKPPVQTTAINMGGGNRADVLVKLTQPGTYTLVRKDYPWAGGAAGTQVLGTIIVSASPLNQPLPSIVPGVPPGYLQPVTSMSAQPFTVAMGAIQSSGWSAACPNVNPPPAHPTNVPYSPPPPSTVNILPGLNVVNCQEYTHPPSADAPPGTWDMFKPTLNSTQQWILSNAGGSSHPFHVHVNPFQVEHWKVDPNGPDNPSNWMWMDTIPVPPPGVSSPPPWFVNNKVTIRTRYSTFAGRFVMHCHILVHEDLGLMANVYVLNDGTGIGPCVKI